LDLVSTMPGSVWGTYNGRIVAVDYSVDLRE